MLPRLAGDRGDELLHLQLLAEGVEALLEGEGVDADEEGSDFWLDAHLVDGEVAVHDAANALNLVEGSGHCGVQVAASY